jgi:uncharacterized protein YbjT (DUF2867 family)
MGRILVLGSTGNVGSAVVNELARAGASVRAASRDPAKATVPAGVEKVRFEYTAPETFAPALAGVDTVFLLAPAGHADTFALTAPFVELATKQVKKIVVMTASGVEFNDAAPLRKIELAVEKSGVKYVFLRPNWFMDNFHTYWLAPIRQAGVIPVPAADAKSAFIDSRDIGAVAAAVLLTDKYDGKGITVSGAEALSYGEAAAILSKAAGREIKYAPVEDGPFHQSLVQAGLSEDYAGLLTALFGFVRQGFAAAPSATVQEITGKPARTLAQYAADHAAVWK